MPSNHECVDNTGLGHIHSFAAIVMVEWGWSWEEALAYVYPDPEKRETWLAMRGFDA